MSEAIIKAIVKNLYDRGLDVKAYFPPTIIETSIFKAQSISSPRAPHCEVKHNSSIYFIVVHGNRVIVDTIVKNYNYTKKYSADNYVKVFDISNPNFIDLLYDCICG